MKLTEENRFCFMIMQETKGFLRGSFPEGSGLLWVQRQPTIRFVQTQDTRESDYTTG